MRPEPHLSAVLRIDWPLDLRETLWQARVGPADPCLRFIAGDVWRATRTPFGPATQRLRRAADGVLQVDAWGAGASWLIEHTPALCGAFDQSSTFQPLDPRVRRLLREHPGLRIGQTRAVFEAALSIVLEQRVATHDAWQSWRWLVHALGERAPGPLPGLWVPPSPDRIARTPYEVFHRFGIERRRADVVRRLGMVARRLEETTGMELDAAYRRLGSIPGVGPWTTARIGLVALGDADAVSIGDLHLPHLVAWALAGEPRGSDERMLELLEPFRGHRGRVVRLLMLASFGTAGQRTGRAWQVR